MTTLESASKQYYVKLEAQSLPVEVNVAIDEGLWYLHKTQRRFTSGANEEGDWTSGGGAATLSYYSCSAANLNAFEVNGHLESGSPDNPYTETVQRGMKRLFELFLVSTGIGPRPDGNPDSDGNGIGIRVNQTYYFYQGGMLMDAIVASGTPNALAVTGPANVSGRTYKAIVQDMVDYYAYGYGAAAAGQVGWRYGQWDAPDNSACQWAAIGMLAAEREFGCTVPAWVRAGNLLWLTYSHNPAGWYGYTSSSVLAWGTYATTPSGLSNVPWTVSVGAILAGTRPRLTCVIISATPAVLRRPSSRTIMAYSLSPKPCFCTIAMATEFPMTVWGLSLLILRIFNRALLV